MSSFGGDTGADGQFAPLSARAVLLREHSAGGPRQPAPRAALTRPGSSRDEVSPLRGHNRDAHFCFSGGRDDGPGWARETKSAELRATLAVNLLVFIPHRLVSVFQSAPGL